MHGARRPRHYRAKKHEHEHAAAGGGGFGECFRCGQLLPAAFGVVPAVVPRSRRLCREIPQCLASLLLASGGGPDGNGRRDAARHLFGACGRVRPAQGSGGVFVEGAVG